MSGGPPVSNDEFERLRDRLGESWLAITSARSESDQKLSDIQALLGTRGVEIPEGTDLILFGSLARREWTSRSDVDWALLTDTRADPEHANLARLIGTILIEAKFSEPGASGLFGTLVSSHELVHTIGGQDDTNKNKTRRILLLPESVSVGTVQESARTNSARANVLRNVLRRYIDFDPSFSRGIGAPLPVPRFLLNDMVRYWRTVAVDYASKKWEQPHGKWALRIIKLRMSRKLLFVKGIALCLLGTLRHEDFIPQEDSSATEQQRSAAIESLLTDQCSQLAEASAIDTLCHLLSRFARDDLARQVVGSYDGFLGQLNDPKVKEHLEQLQFDAAHADPTFQGLWETSREYTRGLRSSRAVGDQPGVYAWPPLVAVRQQRGVHPPRPSLFGVLMRPIGFSTGALAKGDFRRGLDLQRRDGIEAVEHSALRESELPGLLAGFAELDLDGFRYVSFHAPGRFVERTERESVDLLRNRLPPHVPIIVHPDALTDLAAWSSLGSRLCLENMDRRKPTGRTAAELRGFFRWLPEARFCFDIAHARHVDSSMSLAAGLLWEFRERLVQVHFSEVTEDARHVKIGGAAAAAYQQVIALIPESVPVIIESVISEDCIPCEIEAVRRCLHEDMELAVPSARCG